VRAAGPGVASALLLARKEREKAEQLLSRPFQICTLDKGMLRPGPLAAHSKQEPRMSVLKRFLRDESGATAIEYGLIAAGISVAIIVVVKNVGTNLSGTFTSVQNALK
jgi:pilus assembly protein Flp/PilA